MEGSQIVARLRQGIVRGVTAIIVVSTVTSTVMSFMGLRAWAAGHGMIGAGSFIFPGFIDAFPLAAEGVLILAYIDHWTTRSRVLPWVVLVAGMAASVALNVGHMHTTDVLTQITIGLPPVATALSLWVGTSMFKRVLANKPADADELVPVDDGLDLVRLAKVFAADIKAGVVPGRNKIRSLMKPCGHGNARKYQDHLRELVAP